MSNKYMGRINRQAFCSAPDNRLYIGALGRIRAKRTPHRARYRVLRRQRPAQERVREWICGHFTIMITVRVRRWRACHRREARDRIRRSDRFAWSLEVRPARTRLSFGGICFVERARKGIAQVLDIEVLCVEERRHWAACRTRSLNLLLVKVVVLLLRNGRQGRRINRRRRGCR